MNKTKTQEWAQRLEAEWNRERTRRLEAEAEVDRLRAQVAAARKIAFDPETISALEFGVVGCPPNISGITTNEAIEYASNALMDIRGALTFGDPA